MNPHARFKSQSGIYDNHVGKNLDDRTISRYEKLGVYSNEYRHEREERLRREEQSRAAKRKNRERNASIKSRTEAVLKKLLEG